MDSEASFHPWALMYPPLQCHAEGWLDVGDGHAIHWEECGHPLGQPALFVHGGPGAGCTDQDRRWFDPQRWRIVLFDQRGAGKSPAARGTLHANTTPHLVADMEALRQHLGIARWLLFGGSWGATLALAYAQQHPQHVRALVLRGVFTARACETRWLYGAQGAALCHPAAWQRLLLGAGARPGKDLLEAMHDRLHGSDTAAKLAAAHAWWRWEQALMDSETTRPPPPQPACADAPALTMATLGVHYARQGYFLAEGQLLNEAQSLHDLPGVIIQGTRDRVTPQATAQALHHAWPRAKWRSVAAAGHASSHPAIARELIAATDRFALSEEHPAGDNTHEHEGPFRR